MYVLVFVLSLFLSLSLTCLPASSQSVPKFGHFTLTVTGHQTTLKGKLVCTLHCCSAVADVTHQKLEEKQAAGERDRERGRQTGG